MQTIDGREELFVRTLETIEQGPALVRKLRERGRHAEASRVLAQVSALAEALAEMATPKAKRP